MIVSVTERQTYRRCRRKWWLSSPNARNLTPATSVSKALDLGALVHKALADWIISPKEDLEQLFMHHAAARLDQLNKHYLKEVGAPPSDEEVAPLLDAVELGQRMMVNYQGYHKSPLPKHMGFVAPEQEVQIPVPGTEHECFRCTGTGRLTRLSQPDLQMLEVCPDCSGSGSEMHILRGTLDALVQDDRGKIYVLEHKTYGRRPRLDVLDSNDQFLSYIWIVTQLNIGPVGGIAYDGMWKRATPPRNATMDDLFLRKPLHRSDEELEEYSVHLAYLLNEMGSSPFIDYNRRWEGCTDCVYDRLCRTMSRGEDVDYIERTFYQTRERDEPLGVVDEHEPVAEPY